MTSARRAVTPIDIGGLLAAQRMAGPALVPAQKPGLRGMLGDYLFDLARSAGFGSQANRMRQEGMAAADFVPGVGEAVGINEAFRDYGAGNLGMAALGLGTTAIGAVPGVGDAAAAGVKKGIRAYHGSPHDFDRFDMSKIGTGEGAQAYGHGLYFADNEDVAQSYRDNLSRRNVTGKFDGQSLADSRGWWAAIDKLNEEDWRQAKFLDMYGRIGGDKEWFVRQMRDDYRDQPAMLEALDKWSARMEATHRPGRMYEVNINADPDDFLDWDKPLSEQPSSVKNVAREVIGGDPDSIKMQLDEIVSHMSDMAKDRDPVTNRIREEKLWLELAKRRDTLQEAYAKGRTGETLYRMGGHEAFQKAGIPGIKYLDAGSRSAGDGSRNYVVFDDKLIEIVRKYGIAAALSAGIISEEMARQMQEQGVL